VSGFLLDTNVVSELFRPKPNPGVTQFLRGVRPKRLFLSVLTVGELRKGAETAPAERRQELELWIENDLERRFSGRIIPLDLDAAELWGRLSAAEKAAGRTLPPIDGLLAATAVRQGLKLVSRNVRHAPIADVINPWS